MLEKGQAAFDFVARQIYCLSFCSEMSAFSVGRSRVFGMSGCWKSGGEGDFKAKSDF